MKEHIAKIEGHLLRQLQLLEQVAHSNQGNLETQAQVAHSMVNISSNLIELYRFSAPRKP